jgi:putative membrane protein
MMGPMFGFDGGASVLFVVVALLNVAFVVGVIAAIFYGIRWLMRQSANDRSTGSSRTDDTALQLLRQRYARGEIDATEFEERKRTLGG